MGNVVEELTVILVPYRDWGKLLGGDQIDQFFWEKLYESKG